MKRLPVLPAKGRRFSAAERAAAAARATAALAARAAAASGTADTELEADEHAFLVSKLRQRLASLHAGGQDNAAAQAGCGGTSAAEEEAGPAPAADADPLQKAATDPRLWGRREAGDSRLKGVNDIEGLKRKLEEIAYVPPAGMRRTPWIETLAVVAPAGVAAAGAVDGSGNQGEGEAGSGGGKGTKSIGVNADIEREAYFMRLTAAAATEGLRRLRQLRVKFTRPSDFYAEMLKSDKHMERVRERVAEERRQQQLFFEKKNRERNKKFHKKSGHKLIRAQEEARLRNLELQQLEEWKKQRRRGAADDLGIQAGDSSSGATQGRRKQQQRHTAGAAGKGTAVEAALDQWLADRETEKEKQRKLSQQGGKKSFLNMQKQTKESQKWRRRK